VPAVIEAPPRKRKEERPVAVTPVPKRAKRVPIVTAVLVLGGAGAMLAWLAQRSEVEALDVPDPSTSEMVAPVARAIRTAREAVLAEPRSAGTWGALGAVCDAHHLYDEATLCYRRARTLDRSDFRWVYLQAVVRDLQGAPGDEVADLFREALRLQPGYPPAHLRCGDALLRQGRAEEARAAFERALELDPTFAMAHRNLGQVLLALDDVSGAVEHLENAARLAPDDAVVFQSLSQARFRAGDAAGAERAAREAERKQPEYGVPDPIRFAVDEQNATPPACERRARERMERGEWRAARRDLDWLLEGRPDDPLGLAVARALPPPSRRSRIRARGPRALARAAAEERRGVRRPREPRGGRGQGRACA
jgi:tetratricopeptide (TPR) repeat protein